MADAPARTQITIDDLLQLGAQDKWVEVAQGEIIEMSPTGFQHNFVTGNVYNVLNLFAKANNLGYVGSDGLIYVLHVDENGVRDARVPDVSFFRRGKFQNIDLSRPIFGPPDLAVEVVSPTEGDDTVLDKLVSYFTYGTEQVWVMYPRHETVYQYLDLKTIKVHAGEDILEAEALFPGLKIAIKDFFAPPTL